MPKFRKKPVVIEAHQVPAAGDTCGAEMTECLAPMDQNIDNLGDGSLVIHTLEGAMVAAPGDWIIKGVHGEYYPCKPDIFSKTYDPV